MSSAPLVSREDLLDLLERNVRDYAIFMLDPTGVVVSWNTGAQRIKGYSAEEAIGRHFSDFYPPEDLAAGKPEYELRVARTEGRAVDEGWRVRKDGSRFWAHVVITALYDEERRLRGFAKITRDMTDHWQAEQALAASEERFRLLVQDVTDYAIFMLDATGHVVSWNAGAQRIKGYAVSEILGRHFSVFYPREDVAQGRPERNLETALREGRVEDEGWRVRKDGSLFWANVVITALYDEQRRLRGFAKITRDMTQMRRTERVLEERRRLLSHLVQAQEAERRQIAQELHKGAIQQMADVAARQQKLADQVPEPYRAQLTEFGQQMEQVAERLRALLTHLHPPGVNRQSLAEALTGYLTEQANATGLEYTLHDHLSGEPPESTAIAVFRICQEATSNFVRQRGRVAVEITLGSRDDGVLTELAESGAGSDAPSSPRPGLEQVGEAEMRERAEMVGGWWTTALSAEGGTRIKFWIPNLRQEPF